MSTTSTPFLSDSDITLATDYAEHNRVLFPSGVRSLRNIISQSATNGLAESGALFYRHNRAYFLIPKLLEWFVAGANGPRVRGGGGTSDA